MRLGPRLFVLALANEKHVLVERGAGMQQQSHGFTLFRSWESTAQRRHFGPWRCLHSQSVMADDAVGLWRIW
jgi:hypothetical protein